MILKIAKYGLVSVAGAALVGGAMFGSDLCSYAKSSSRAVRSAVKDNIPVEFELRRARDMVSDLGPEIQSCVRQVARQEVEIAALRRETEQSRANLQAERSRVQGLRDALGTKDAALVFHGIRYSRDQVKDDLTRRFDLLKEAEAVLAGKERLLQNRERSLAAAASALDRTRTQRAMLEGQIATLETQHQLLKSASAGTAASIDDGKLAQAQRMLAKVKTELDVAERVLAHEARFTDAPPIEAAVDEADLLTKVDEHLTGKAGEKGEAAAKADGNGRAEQAAAATGDPK